MTRNKLKFWIFWRVMCHWLLSPDIQRNTVPSPSRIEDLVLLGPCNSCRWRHYVLLKHQETLTQQHSITSLQTWILNNTTVVTWNPAKKLNVNPTNRSIKFKKNLQVCSTSAVKARSNVGDSEANWSKNGTVAERSMFSPSASWWSGSKLHCVH